MSRIKCSNEFLYRVLSDGTLFLVNERTGDHLSLNRTARLFVEAIAEGTDPSELVDAFEKRFGVARNEIEADLDSLTVELQRLGVIVVEPATGEHSCT